ncbi:HbrB-like protein [Sodiomyces alkalinus F11]|uniref:HbrB-like protein n=1 Tax=Sodiomyces alkalinus (strain CBS 110278 / VKM F-3762 / F11) TaxID=1314773 RepID=A0A3N2Q0E0_SODAK|nr:HbrB-like protein [Sodiomyces alkalinus F11]ROT40229.1 HbrB-like protein [Sodiomyces alkalinus F11]
MHPAQPSRPPPRAPGSFSPLPGAVSQSSSTMAPQRPRPPPRLDSETAEDDSSIASLASLASLHVARQRSQLTAHPNSSSTSINTNPHNFSRPTAQRPHGSGDPTSAAGHTSSPLRKARHHARKHSHTQGLFEPTLPSTSTSNLSQIGMTQTPTPTRPQSPALTASQIAAQAAFQHQNNANSIRQRSQTVPPPVDGNGVGNDGARRGSSGRGPLSPPMLSLTEASAPRESGFGNQGYHNGLLGSYSAAAATAANAAYPRSGQTSPKLPQPQPQPHPSPTHVPVAVSEAARPAKPEKEKSKVKLFSRPGKIVTKIDTREKPMPSPSKIGSALASLQRGNFSTTSLVDTSSHSLYSMNNSSSATIRPIDTPAEREGKEREKEKEKRHNFLSRQKQKLKEDYHLALSSASSNSKPTDPSAPTSLYSFNVPASPVPSSGSFTKVRKDKKVERSESRLDGESTFSSEWPASGSLTTLANASSAHLLDPVDSSKYGLNSMALDDAWPYLKAKMIVVFEGEDPRQPVEDFNRLVNLHIQYCIQRRSPTIIVDDFRELLTTGFTSLDRSLRRTQEDKFIPALVEMWLITYTSILPFLQAVFLPLDLEFSGCGSLMTPEQARDFWGGVIAGDSPEVSPASSVLDVRRLVLTAFRDIVILPRYETLKTIFSRLSLEFLPSTFAQMALSSPSPSPSPDFVSALSTSPATQTSDLGGGMMMRPGTAMSLDPSVASYGSTSTTLLGDTGSATGSHSAASRSRAISNVSFASGGSDGQLRPFTPSSLGHQHQHQNQHQHQYQHQQTLLGSVREQNVEDSKQVTEMVGRMLQCMSILAGVGVAGDGSDEANKKMEELCRLLKLNWLGRGRTGRNRRGIVGGRVKRDVTQESVKEALRVA